jgi:hypothetical protein
MRGRDRNVRIFFAGTLSGSAYTENFRFPILTRDKILGHVISRMGHKNRFTSDGIATDFYYLNERYS